MREGFRPVSVSLLGGVSGYMAGGVPNPLLSEKERTGMLKDSVPGTRPARSP